MTWHVGWGDPASDKLFHLTALLFLSFSLKRLWQTLALTTGCIAPTTACVCTSASALGNKHKCYTIEVPNQLRLPNHPFCGGLI